MEIIGKTIRYKICFICKMYMPIHTTNPINITELGIFEKTHSGHMLQTVNYNDISKGFTCIKSDKTRKQAINQIREELLEV